MTPEAEPRTSEVFEMLGHETRLAIIEELAKRQRTQWRPSGLGFADLRAAVGVEDAGKFNYHLGKLTDHFVEKRGEEYVLRNTGLELAGAILAGTYTRYADTRHSQLDRGCPVCDARLEATYERGHIRVECPDHGRLFANAVAPGGAASRTIDDLLSVATRDARHVAEHARGGVCSHCWGEMNTTVPADPPPMITDRLEDGAIEDGTIDTAVADVLARFSCERCGMRFWFPVTLFVLDHPAVVSLCYDHGIDIREWDYLQCGVLVGGNDTVVSADPTRVTVTVEVEDDALELTLDGTLTVVDVEELPE